MGHLRSASRMVCIGLLLGCPDTVSAAPGQAAGPASVNDAAAASDPASAKAETTAETGDDIEDLVVTARRRPEFLEETPVAATVLGGELLEQRGIDSIEDIGVYVPNLTAFSGAQRQGSFFSRGVGQRDAIVTLDPGVGLYVDDVYVARGQGALLPTLDLERVEVLRGPQGTLYGKNTIGGAIKLISQKPGPEPYVAGSLGTGNYESVEGSATANVPLIDNLLYSRITIAGDNSEGYSKNLADGTHYLPFPSVEANGNHYDNENLAASRLQLRLLPSDAVTLDFSGHYTHQREDSRGAKCRISNPATASVLPAFLGLIPACQASENASTYHFYSNLNDHYFLDTYGGSLVAAWEGGKRFGFLDSLDLKSVSAVQDQEVLDGFLDLDATANPFVNLFTRTEKKQRQTQWSQELQSVSAMLDDRARLTTGLYGFWETTGGGDVLTSSFGNDRLERTTIANQSYAAYGQLSVTPVEWLELTGGLRGTWERKNAERTIKRPSPPPPPEQPVENASDTFSQLTPMAGFSLKAPAELIEDTPLGSGIFYFTYSQGYKSGGFSTRRNPALFRISEFDPEKLDNYEIGLKLDMFDNRVLFNTALFYSDYQDIQLTVLRVNPNSPPFQPDAGSTTANAGKATIKGLELELITRPWRELVVRASLGLTDAQYDKFIDQTWDINPGTGLVENIRPRDRSNENFTNVPEVSIDGSVEYPIKFTGLGLPDYGALTPLVHVYHQSSTDMHITAEGFESKRFRQDPYTLLDLRLIWDLWDGRTQVSLFANNLLDTDYFESAIDLTNTLGFGSVYYSAPRTFGGEIRYRWYNPSFLAL
ncbi:MAG TPA: TonB-dependent receptor [Myxococcota bacterium]|nr:TonB-dependent receptor [Myxococcota bacterium]